MDRFDDALEILDGAGPEYAGGLSNHGPMAAEALFAMGRADAVVPWTEGYRRKLGDEPAPAVGKYRALVRLTQTAGGTEIPLLKAVGLVVVAEG